MLDAGEGPKQAMWVPVSQALALLNQSTTLAKLDGLFGRYRNTGISKTDESDLLALWRLVDASDYFSGDALWNGLMRSVDEREQLDHGAGGPTLASAKALGL